MAPPQSGYSHTEIWIELVFGNVDFWGEGRTGVSGEKPLGAEKRNNNKLNPRIASSPSSRIDPEPHRWEVSAIPCSLWLRYTALVLMITSEHSFWWLVRDPLTRTSILTVVSFLDETVSTIDPTLKRTCLRWSSEPLNENETYEIFLTCKEW